MSHLYPLAEDARGALDLSAPVARTRFDAERLGAGAQVLKLTTEWISETEGDLALSDVEAQAASGRGFIQAYEDEAGRPVYAVTYWQMDGPVGTAPDPDAASEAGEAEPAEPVPDVEADEDHTDDLYFRVRRGRRQRKPYVDPRQLDLFIRPDGRGFEHAEGGAVITDEEGDGTTFGG
ncbi:MAG: hypothetical protein AAGH87_08145 [Pseudomonadota bacterium]